MTFPQVPTENSKYHPQFNPSYSSSKETAYDSYKTEHTELTYQPSNFKNPQIEKYLNRFAEKGLPGFFYVTGYLYDQHRRNCRPNTIRSSSTAIFLFLSHLKSLGRGHIETVTREDMGSFVEYQQDCGLKPSSVYGRTKAIYAFLFYLVERDIVHPDIVKKRLYVKVPDSLPRAIDPVDVRRLLSVIKMTRDRAMILVLLRTGMRIGELLNTKFTDVNFSEKRIEIFEASKNRSGRVVYLSDDACCALKTWLKQRCPQKDFLFYGRGHNPLGYSAARVRFCKCLEAAGLSRKGYTLHCLRHTFASELLNAGMRLEYLQQLLGHSNIEMTRRYARLTDNTRREEYFRAMAIIEKGGIHGHYRLDHQLS